LVLLNHVRGWETLDIAHGAHRRLYRELVRLSQQTAPAMICFCRHPPRGGLPQLHFQYARASDVRLVLGGAEPHTQARRANQLAAAAEGDRGGDGERAGRHVARASLLGCSGGEAAHCPRGRTADQSIQISAYEQLRQSWVSMRPPSYIIPGCQNSAISPPSALSAAQDDADHPIRRPQLPRRVPHTQEPIAPKCSVFFESVKSRGKPPRCTRARICRCG